jgi:hypothetical protein
VHWVEADTRQAFVRARVAGASRIDIETRWARSLRVYVHDRLLDLDRPVEIRINGASVFADRVKRSAVTALQGAWARGDERLIDAAEIRIDVPAAADALAVGERAFNELTPKRQEGTLSFWEMFATRALEERWPAIGIEGVEDALPPDIKAAPEQVAVRVRHVDPDGLLAAAALKPGDLLIELGGEPFFRGRGGLTSLHHWLIRELRNEPASYAVTVWRDGRRLEATVRLKLGPYSGS